MKKTAKTLWRFNNKDNNKLINEFLSDGFAKGINEFSNAIDQLILEDEENTLKSVLLFLDKDNNTEEFLTAILKDNEAMESLLKNSYNHQNGFDKIVLIKGNNFKLRLHNFHPISVQRPQENIHDHRWLFSSMMLTGQFGMDFHEDGSKGEQRYHYTYHSDKSTGKYETILNGIRNLKTIEKTTVSAGDKYIMPTDALHKITSISNTGAATIVMTGLNRRNTCKLFSLNPITKEQKNIDPLAHSQVCEIFDQIINKIKTKNLKAA